jgi:hypothetical protein
MNDGCPTQRKLTNYIFHTATVTQNDKTAQFYCERCAGCPLCASWSSGKSELPTWIQQVGSQHQTAVTRAATRGAARVEPSIPATRTRTQPAPEPVRVTRTRDVHYECRAGVFCNYRDPRRHGQTDRQNTKNNVAKIESAWPEVISAKQC